MDDEKQLEVQVLPGPRRAATRRVFSTEEKRAIVEETYKPGSSVSLVARQYSLSPSLVFRWRKLMDDGSMSGLGAGEPVVPEAQRAPEAPARAEAARASLDRTRAGPAEHFLTAGPTAARPAADRTRVGRQPRELPRGLRAVTRRVARARTLARTADCQPAVRSGRRRQRAE